MLGEILAEERGKITGTRVLPSDGHGPKLEVSFQASGKLQGVDATDMGTYVAVLTSDGTLFGEGQGVIMTADGGVVAWRGQGLGRPTGQGLGAHWRGAIYYQTTSQKLAHLNSVVAIFEYEVDGEGNTEDRVWEWK